MKNELFNSQRVSHPEYATLVHMVPNILNSFNDYFKQIDFQVNHYPAHISYDEQIVRIFQQYSLPHSYPLRIYIGNEGKYSPHTISVVGNLGNSHIYSRSEKTPQKLVESVNKEDLRQVIASYIVSPMNFLHIDEW